MKFVTIKNFKGLMAALVAALVFSLPDAAYADDTGIAEVIQNTLTGSTTLPAIFSMTSYLFGLVLGALAVAKLYEHVNNPSQVPIWEPVKKLAAGGLFFSLPSALEIAQTTLIGDDTTAHSETGLSLPGTSGDGLDAIMVRLVEDLWGNMQWLISSFGYLFGIALIMIAIGRQMGSMQDGAKAPGGVGTIMTFLIGGVLISLDSIMGAMSQTMFGTPEVTTEATANFLTSSSVSTDEQEHVTSVITAILMFVMILGWISFVKGFIMLRAVADGEQQASMMAAMTHIFGGALAVNLGPVLNAIQNTLEIIDYGIEFS